MTYYIDYSDPLRTGFIIPAGTYNGPGGTNINGSLRLYGRGALEWGESVDENLLRLNENWAGATPPPYPIEGQVWYQQYFFWLQTATNWFAWDPNASAWGPALTVVGLTAGTDTPPPVPTVGTYWYTGAAPSAVDVYNNPVQPFTLYEWNSQYEQTGLGWLQRIHTENAGAPSGVPASQLKVWNGSAWVNINKPFASTTPPINPAHGDLWYDTANDILYAWNGSAWVPVNNSVFVNVAGDTMTGLLVLSGDPVAPLGAATKQYVDNNFVELAGDTMTGSLVLSGQTFGYPGEAATVGWVTAYVAGAGGAFVLKAGDTMTGNLNMTNSGVNSVNATSYFAKLGSPGLLDTTNHAVEIRNNGAGEATIAFHCQGSYATKLSLRNDGVFSIGGWSASPYTWYVDCINNNMVMSGNINCTGTLYAGGAASLATSLNVGTTIYAGGDITAFSDISLKEDIEPITNALEIVKQWVGVHFTDKKTKEQRVGFVADNIEQSAPRLVKIHEESGKKALAYQNSTAYLAEAIKTLDEKLEAIKAMIEGKK